MKYINGHIPPGEIEQEVKVSIEHLPYNNSLAIRVGTWYVLEITREGTLKRTRCISPGNGVGLEVNGAGQIILRES